jgi:xylulokinase
MRMAHGLPHFTRAVLESIACVLKDNLDLIENHGLISDEIRMGGGGTKGTLLMQICADMLNKRVRVMETEDSTCLGVAIVSCVATGIYPDIATAVAKMVRFAHTYEPDSARHKIYTALYAEYLKCKGIGLGERG